VPTRSHQRILAIVLKRMKQRGFTPTAVDGRIESASDSGLVRPFSLGRHRPDAIGVAEDGKLCIGEAKTADDIGSSRTREQLEDYLGVLDVDYPEVILGYPSSAATVVQRLLEALGAIDCPQLELISVPDELLDAQ
jgi:hypothetical protein